MNRIDRRVVEMAFVNSQFENGIAESIGSLDRLQESLNLQTVGDGFDDVEKGIGQLKSSFNALDAVVFSVVQNITNRLMNMGISAAHDLLFGNLMKGFSGYEHIMNRTLNIYRNASDVYGSTLGQVEDNIEVLRDYAAVTVFNIEGLVDALKGMTQARVPIDEATRAILGFANAGAYAGASAEDVDTALTILSRSMKGGIQRLQDWDQIYSRIGGPAFVNALLDASVAVGDLNEDMADMVRSGAIHIRQFQDQTGDFGHRFTGEALSLAAEFLYANEQMSEAATRVQTLTRLRENMQTVVAKGWIESWQIVIGDVEQSAKLFTTISNWWTNIVKPINNARNAMLSFWRESGGMYDVMRGLNNIVNQVLRVVSAISVAFRNVFPRRTQDDVRNMSRNFRNMTESFQFSERTLINIMRVFQGVFSVMRIGINVSQTLWHIMAQGVRVVTPLINVLWAVAAAFGDLISYVARSGTVFASIRNIATSLAGVLNNLFGVLFGEISFNIGFNNIARSFEALFVGIFSLIGAAAKSIKMVLQGIFADTAIGEILAPIFETMRVQFDGFITFLGEQARRIRDAVSGIDFAISGIGNIDLSGFRLFRRLDEDDTSVFGVIANIFTTSIGAMVAVTTWAWPYLRWFAGALFTWGKEILRPFVDMYRDNPFQILIHIFEILRLWASGRLMWSLSDLASGITDMFVGIAEAVTSLGNAITMHARAAAFKSIATGVAILVGSLIALAIVFSDDDGFNSEKLQSSLIAVGALLGMLAATFLVVAYAMNALSASAKGVKAKTETVLSSIWKPLKGAMQWRSVGTAIVGIGVGMIALAASMLIFQHVDWSSIGKGLVVFSTFMVVMTVFAAFATSGPIIAMAASLGFIAIGFLALAGSLWVLGRATGAVEAAMITIWGIFGSLTALAVVLAKFKATGGIAAMTKAMISIAIGIVALVGAMHLIATAPEGSFEQIVTLMQQTAFTALLLSMAFGIFGKSLLAVKAGLAATAATGATKASLFAKLGPALTAAGKVLLWFGAGLTLTGAGMYLFAIGAEKIHENVDSVVLAFALLAGATALTYLAIMKLKVALPGLYTMLGKLVVGGSGLVVKIAALGPALMSFGKGMLWLGAGIAAVGLSIALVIAAFALLFRVFEAHEVAGGMIAMFALFAAVLLFIQWRAIGAIPAIGKLIIKINTLGVAAKKAYKPLGILVGKITALNVAAIPILIKIAVIAVAVAAAIGLLVAGFILFIRTAPQLIEAIAAFGREAGNLALAAGVLTLLGPALVIFGLGLLTVTPSLLTISVAIMMLSVALGALSKVSLSGIGTDIVGFARAISTLTIGQSASLIAFVIIMAGLASAMILGGIGVMFFANGLYVLAQVPLGELAKNILAFVTEIAKLTLGQAAGMVAFITTLGLLSTFLTFAGLGMIAFAGGLWVLSKVPLSNIAREMLEFVNILSNLTGEQVVAITGFILIGGLLSVFLAALGVALLVASIGVLAFGGAMWVLAKVPWKELADNSDELATVVNSVVDAIFKVGMVSPMLAVLGVMAAAAGVGIAILAIGVLAMAGALWLLIRTAEGSEVITRFLESFLDIMLDILGSITPLIDSFTAINNAIANGINGIADAFSRGGRKAKNAASEFSEGVVAACAAPFEIVNPAMAIYRIGASATEGMTRSLEDGTPEVYDAGLGLGEGVMSGIDDSINPEQVGYLTSSVVGGFTSGLKDGREDVYYSGADMASGVLEGIRDELGINSDAETTKTLAGYTIGGFTTGMEDGKGEIEKSTKKGITDVVTDTIGGFISNQAPDLGFGLMEGIGSGMADFDFLNIDFAGFARPMQAAAKEFTDDVEKRFAELNETIRDTWLFDASIHEVSVRGLQRFMGARLQYNKLLNDRLHLASSELQELHKRIQRYEDLLKVESTQYYVLIEQARIRSMLNRLHSRRNELLAEEFDMARRLSDIYEDVVVPQTFGGGGRDLQRERDDANRRLFEEESTRIHHLRRIREVGLYDELQMWKEVQAMFEEGCEQRANAEFEMFDAIIAHRDMNILSLKEEYELWSYYLDQFEEGTAQRRRIEVEMFDLRGARMEEAYSKEANMLKHLRRLGRITREEEIDAWMQLQRVFDHDIDLRRDAEVNMFDAIAAHRDKNIHAMQREYQTWADLHRRFVNDTDHRKRIEIEMHDIRTWALEEREKMEQRIVDLNEQQDRDLESKTERIRTTFGLFDKVAEREEVHMTDLVERMREQRQESNRYFAAIRGLYERGLPPGMLEELVGKGISALSELEAMVESSEAQMNWSIHHWYATGEEAAKFAEDVFRMTGKEIDSQVSEIEEHIKELDAIIDDVDFRGTGEQIVEDVTKGMTSPRSKELMISATNTFIDQSIDVLESNETSRRYSAAGNQNGTRYSLGMNETHHTAITAGMRLAEAGSSAAMTPESIQGFVTAGRQGAQGFINGLLQLIDQVENAGGRLALASISGLTISLDARSPSEVTTEIGKDGGRGFIIGLLLMLDEVGRAGELLGFSAVDTMRDAIAYACDVLERQDLNYEPRITPVLNLDQAEHALQRLFDERQQMQIDKISAGEARIYAERDQLRDAATLQGQAGMTMTVEMTNYVRSDMDINKINVQLNQLIRRMNRTQGVVNR